MGEACLLLASMARCLPGSRMGLSTWKMRSPHLGDAKHPTSVLLYVSLVWGSSGSPRCLSPRHHRFPSPRHHRSPGHQEPQPLEDQVLPSPGGKVKGSLLF